MADERRPRKKKAAPDAAAEARQPSSADELRRQAEELLAGLAEAAAAGRAPEELTTAVHELRVHQIELEMQNEELRRARLELDVQRQKYFELFDLAPVGYLTVSDKGIVGDANLTAARLLGVERQLLVGQPFSSFVLPPDRDAYYRHLREVATTGEPQTCELRLQRLGCGAGGDAQAGHFWAHCESLPQRAADGEPLSTWIAFGDVGDLKRAEEALRAAAARLSDFAYSGADWLWEVDANAVYTYSSQKSADFFGPSRGDVIGKTPFDLMPPDEAERVAPLFAELAARKAPIVDLENWSVNADGERFCLLTNGVPILDEAGNLTGYRGADRDITERKRGAEELERHREHLEELVAARTDELSAANRIVAERAAEVTRSRQNFDTFFNTIDDLLFVLDAGGNMIHVNETVCRRLGYAEEELIGRPILDVHPPARRGEAGRIVAAMLAGEVDFCPVPVVTSGGAEIPVETRVVPGVWDGQRALFGVTKDVSALKLSEEKFDRLFRRNPALMAVSRLPERIYTDVNEAFVSALGYSREEVLGRTATELGLFAEAEQQQGVAEQLQAQGRAGDRELKVRRKDGTVLDGLFSGEIIESQGQQYFLTVMIDQTERSLATQALQESEALYRSILDASPEGITITDLEGRVRMASPAGLRMFGFEREEEIADRPLAASLVPEDRERAQADLALLLHGAYRGPSEYRGLRADGGAFAIEVNAEFIRDADEQPTGIVFITHDISARKRAEEALRESEEKYRTVADFTYDWEAWRAPDGTYRYVSPSCERITGHAAAEFLADPDLLMQITHPDDRSEVVEHYQAAAHEAQDQALGLDYRILAPSGETRWIGHSCTAVYGADGQWLGRRESNRDITARRQTEDALRESEETLRATIENSFDVIFALDEEGVFLFVSAAWERHFGYPVSDVLQKSFAPFVHPDDVAPLVDYLKRVLSAGKSETSPAYRVKHADGGWRWFVSNGTPYVDAEGARQYIGVGRDISERKEAEQNARLFAQAQTELNERKQEEEAQARSAAQLREQLHDTVKAMGAIVSLRDPYTAAHERRVTELAVAIAVELGLSEEAREGLAFAGEVHDIGKIGVPAEILSKPAALRELEMTLVKQHPQAGRELLGAIRFRQPVAEIVGQHHERLDGSGYPDGLKGDEIVFEARILAVADVVEAMASHRPYRAALGLDAALAEVHGAAGVRYDAGAVAACERVFAQGFVFSE